MDRQYIHSVSSTLLRSRSIHQAKQIILNPLFNSSLLNSFTLFDERQISQAAAPGTNEQSVKLAVQIYQIFAHLRVRNLTASIETILSTLTTVGSIIKSQDSSDTSSSLSIPALTGSLQALSTLGRKLYKESSLTPQPLLDSFRLEYAHLRRDAKLDMHKKISMVIVLIEMIKICVIDLSKPNIIESILASTQGILDQNDDTPALPKSISTTYHFYLSKHFLFLDNFNESRVQLETALGQLTPGMANTGRVLYYLIPLQLVRGVFPTKNLLRKFPQIHTLYYPIIRAIRSRNLAMLHQLIDQQLPLKKTFFFLLKKLDLLVYRLILKDIFFHSGGRKQISFSLFNDVMPGKCTSEIFAILIQDGMINGYISYEENVLVLTGSNPFPLGPWSS